MASKTYKVGVIGYGFSAKIFHIPFINAVPELSFHAVVQRSPTEENNAEKDHPGVKSYRSTEEMLQDVDVEVVVVTTVPESHFALAKLSLEAGKHVIVEKPFTPTYKEAKELVALAKKQNKLLTVYQNRRWDADFVTLSSLIKDGSLGRVVEFETHFDRYRPEVPNPNSWKVKPMAGGGAIYDLGAHLIDQAVHLFGLPLKITGFIGCQREIKVEGFEDSFTVLLHYDGLMVTAKSSVISPEENQLRFWVRGDKGSFKKYHLDPQEGQLLAGMRPGDPSYGIEGSEKYGTLTQSKDGKLASAPVSTSQQFNYTDYYRQFGKALAGQGDLPVDPEVSAAVIRLIELAQESSRLEQTLKVRDD